MFIDPDGHLIVKELILNGADIVTDTNMALAGINKKKLACYGGEAHCFMADEKVASLAKERGTTRAAISMEMAARIKKPVIFAIGNAPTALIQLYEMIQSGNFKPAFVIGVPVGFVNVEAAKELIMETDVPYIVNRGRKGGSNIAAAICNAIIYELGRELK
jgi:precorrin-8X/cobalt-precorrin-8 methylmutase